MELLILINEKDDLIHKQTFPYKEDSNSKEYSKEDLNSELIIKIYGSIDILKIHLGKSNTTYFGSLDTFRDYKISALVYPSNYKCIFIHKQTKNVKRFLYDVYYLYRHYIIFNITEEVDLKNIYKKYY